MSWRGVASTALSSAFSALACDRPRKGLEGLRPMPAAASARRPADAWGGRSSTASKPSTSTAQSALRGADRRRGGVERVGAALLAQPRLDLGVHASRSAWVTSGRTVGLSISCSRQPPAGDDGRIEGAGGAPGEGRVAIRQLQARDVGDAGFGAIRAGSRDKRPTWSWPSRRGPRPAQPSGRRGARAAARPGRLSRRRMIVSRSKPASTMGDRPGPPGLHSPWAAPPSAARSNPPRRPLDRPGLDDTTRLCVGRHVAALSGTVAAGAPAIVIGQENPRAGVGGGARKAS